MIRIAFAGDRDISVWVLEYLLREGVRPLALCVSDPERATHSEALKRMCTFLEQDRILIGTRFREAEGLDLLRSLDLDFVIGVHFPYLVRTDVLQTARQGVLNLHPAYLPSNRGWHTPSWAILDGTPYGATLHFMDENIDTGDIVHRKRIDVSPGDTANTLYQRVKRLELEVFQEAWPGLSDGTFKRLQQTGLSPVTIHQRKELLTPGIQRIDMNTMTKAGDLINRLRALTTDRSSEAAYFERDGVRYRLQLTVKEEPILVEELSRKYHAKWRELLVSPELSILETMRIMEHGTQEIVIVVDLQGNLLGTVTDGDVRRGILSGLSLSDPISRIMNPEAVTITPRTSPHEAREIMLNRVLKHLPVVDEMGRVVGILAWAALQTALADSP